jgi:hypothetical protein
MRKEIIVLLCILVFFAIVAWKIYDQTANGSDARNMKCIAIANKQKQGGITYDELKYKRENCDLY